MRSSDWLSERAIPRGKAGEVGIELELEGNFEFQSDLTDFWNAKEEHSLRGGYEFVLRKPIELVDLDRALSDLEKTLEKSQIHPTIRCSTHIHVNVSKMSHRQIYNAVGYYFLLEDLLVQTQGPLRIGNLFCLRMSDAETIAHDLSESVRRQTGFGQFSMDSHKYGAVNLAAVRKFGSLEFRFFRPLKTPQIAFWSRLLHRMIRNAADIPLSRPIDLLEKDRYTDVLRLCLLDEEIDILTQGVVWQPLLETNFEAISDLAKALEKPRKYEIPMHIVEALDDFEGDGGEGIPVWQQTITNTLILDDPIEDFE